ncbi:MULTISPECIES: DUF2470 domain-containing protein [Thermomonosporaceae]|uniref:DUF2470 domain-containing protein n=1 Tax=Thermomonosporaceae TaxID=2012 RepID=UPI00255AEC87|nr:MULTISPECIES: DUF2470 domain-containing protein [Thermomonosporaceae]MDL4775537.1 DUF2470 domain-containing protein [Actinomadura xylanilytica]
MSRTDSPERRPTAAERARSLAYGVADGVLAVPGVPYAPVPAHATDRDGRPLLLMPAASPVVAALAGEPDLPATLHISDVAPVPLPDRVRGRARLHGWITEVPAADRRAAALRLSHLHPRPELLDFGAAPAVHGAWTVLALEAAEIEVEDAWGSAIVEPEEYAAATPDPFVAIEASVLAHLDSCHREELMTLLPGMAAGEVPPVPMPVVRPLALDRHGMWLRCSIPEPGGPDPFDLRLAFSEPVRDLDGLRCVYRRLFAGATT